jgi:hypothetical protein
MNSFRLVLCLTGLLAYVIGKQFTSSKDEPVILTGPGQDLSGVGLVVEKIDPGSLMSKRAPAPAILKAIPEQIGAPNEDQDNASTRTDLPKSAMPQRVRHLTLNAAGALK